MQTEIASIYQQVQQSLSEFNEKKGEMDATGLQYYQFLEEISQRSETLNKYMEQLLSNEREFTQEKQNYEKLLAKKIRDLRKDESQLKGSLEDARQQLILLCNKKAQIGKVLVSVSQTIAEFSSQEKNLDHLCEQAETMTKQAMFVENNDKDSVDVSEQGHIVKMNELVEQQLNSVQSRIAELERQKSLLDADTKKTNRRIDVLNRLIDLKQEVGGQKDDLESLEHDQISKKTALDAKKRMLAQLKEEKDKIEKEVAKHKSVECEIFLDSRRSFDHSKMIKETARLVHLQAEECADMIKVAKSELDSKLFQEENLRHELEYVKADISGCDTDNDRLRSQLDNATHEAEMLSAIEIDLDETMAVAKHELDVLAKAKRQAAIEEEAMKIEAARRSFSEFGDDQVQAARIEATKRVKLVEYEIESVQRDIEDLRAQIQNRTTVDSRTKGREALIESDMMKMKALAKECRELFGSDFSESTSEMESRIKSRSFSREINNRQLKSHVSTLAESISRMRSVLEAKRDSVSKKRATYSSSVITGYSQITAFTPTLKRSQRFPQIQNTLEDRIHVLSLVCQTLENLLGHITTQLQLWHTSTPQLEDWSRILDRMQDKADDLVVWKQLFCHSETDTNLF